MRVRCGGADKTWEKRKENKVGKWSVHGVGIVQLNSENFLWEKCSSGESCDLESKTAWLTFLPIFSRKYGRAQFACAPIFCSPFAYFIINMQTQMFERNLGTHTHNFFEQLSSKFRVESISLAANHVYTLKAQRVYFTRYVLSCPRLRKHKTWFRRTRIAFVAYTCHPN